MMKNIIALSVALLVGAFSLAQAADVKENWEKHCQKCHGEDGKGDTKMGKKSGVKDLTDAQHQASFSDEKAFKVIKEGLVEDDKVRMKPAEDLTDAEIHALVKYTRSFKK